eukprot:1174348-Ditylum_brightwellii.AAC.1
MVVKIYFKYIVHITMLAIGVRVLMYVRQRLAYMVKQCFVKVVDMGLIPVEESVEHVIFQPQSSETWIWVHKAHITWGSCHATPGLRLAWAGLGIFYSLVGMCRKWDLLVCPQGAVCYQAQRCHLPRVGEVMSKGGATKAVD